MPWLGIEPTTLAYQDNALTNWATQPGPLECNLICHPFSCIPTKSKSALEAWYDLEVYF